MPQSGAVCVGAYDGKSVGGDAGGTTMMAVRIGRNEKRNTAIKEGGGVFKPIGRGPLRLVLCGGSIWASPYLPQIWAWYGECQSDRAFEPNL